MPTRECLDCGRLTTRHDSRCPTCASTHNRRRDHTRGSRHHRGYDSRHDATRDRLLRELAPGTPCPRCGQPMWPWQDLDAAHPAHSPLRTNRTSRADHLEHAACNRGER